MAGFLIDPVTNNTYGLAVSEYIYYMDSTTGPQEPEAYRREI